MLDARSDIEWAAGLEWSRTGEHVSFMVRNGPDTSLMRVALGTSSVEAVLAGEQGWSVPKYSPDGHRMLLTLDSGSDGEIWSMAVDGDDRARLTVGHADRAAAWSPDGNRIVFLRAGQIHIMNADGSDVAELPIDGVTEVEWSG